MSESSSREEERPKQMLRATVTLGLKAIVTPAVIQPAGFGPPASRDVCRYSFLSIFDRVLQRGRATSASTSRTTLAIMATPCRIRERLDQRSKRAEKIVRGNRARILRLFVKQDVAEIQELVYFARKNSREKCDINFLTWNTSLRTVSPWSVVYYLPHIIDIFQV